MSLNNGYEKYKMQDSEKVHEELSDLLHQSEESDLKISKVVASTLSSFK